LAFFLLLSAKGWPAGRGLRLGADPNIHDERFDSTPLGWARCFGQQPLIELLEPITEATAE
jgi:hypothetical protein